MDPNLRHLIRLNLTRRIARRGMARLLEAFGSLERGLAAREDRLAAVRGIGPETARAIIAATDAAAEAELGRAAAIGARIVGLGGEGYPRRLAETDDPPLILSVRGELRESAPAAAVVGARRATTYGLRAAAAIARGLAEAAVTVVSGLARGIDAAAHRAAVEAGGRTIAVLGSGLDRPYPPEHDGLCEDIVRSGGAVVSEFPLGTPPLAFHFPRRNRVVAGLSQGVVVVEAAERSGSLITAEWALEQGREVMAVPGRIDDGNAAGCNRLIQDGAALVAGADDVIAALGIGPGRERRKARAIYDPEATPAGLSAEEERIFAVLGCDPLHVDEVIEASGLPAARVFSTLTALELRRAVKTWPGKMYARAG